MSSTNADPLTTVSSIGNVYAYFAINEKKFLSFTEGTTPGGNLAKKIKNMPEVLLLLSDKTLYSQKGRIEKRFERID